MVGVLEAERWGWELVCALHGKSRSPNRCQHLGSMTLTLCMCDLKLYWLLLQLSRLACHLESIIYFCLLYLNRPPDRSWLGTGVAASVWEADLYCLSARCGLQNSLTWLTKDTTSVLPKWHNGMKHTPDFHMQCMFMSSGLTNGDSKNRPVLEKRLDVLSLFKSLVFLQIKAAVVFHSSLKMSVQSKVCWCHKLGPEVSRFIVAVFSSFVSKAWIYCEYSLFMDFRTKAPFHKHSCNAPGSYKLYRHLTCRVF